jgi:cytochrome P450
MAMTRNSTLKKIPAVRPWDVIGSTLAFKRDQLAFLADGIASHGPIFRFRPLGLPFVLVNHPDYVRHVLVDKAEMYDKDATIFKVVRPVLRNGLIANADMELWRRQRRMMAQHFTPRAVTAFARNMTDETERMLERWEDRADGTGFEFDITEEIGQLALRIVNRSLFSADVSEDAQAFARAFAVANNILGSFFRFPFPPLSVPTPTHRRLRRAIDEMDEFVAGFVQARLRNGAPDSDRTDLLTLFLHTVDEEDGKGMDLEQLRYEVLNICIGAYETTTNALSWTFYLLARHPDVEARLHAEIDEVLAGRVPGFEDLPRLAYTRMVIEETLRIYSPAYQTMRRAREEDEIDGYRVPANSNILINSYFLHRNPEFWDDPERFDPDRFRPERVAERPKHVYIPFGGGLRICIGRHFALTELILVLATIARSRRMVLPDGAREVVPDPLITLHPRGGIRLRLEHRA